VIISGATTTSERHASPEIGWCGQIAIQSKTSISYLTAFKVEILKKLTATTATATLFAGEFDFDLVLVLGHQGENCENSKWWKGRFLNPYCELLIKSKC